MTSVTCNRCKVGRLCEGQAGECPTCAALREQLVELVVARALAARAGELPRFELPAGCPPDLREAIEAWAEALAECRRRDWAFQVAKAARVLEADARRLGGAEAFATLQADVGAAAEMADAARLEVERRGAWLVWLQQVGGSLDRSPLPKELG